MDEISLKGENYVKASILARKFGYTSDYVGQLCRSDQVTATLIGRSWYVTEESLLRHKKGRYRSSLAKSKEMVRKYAEEYRQAPRTTNVKRIVRYEEDEGDLLPTLRVREISSSALETLPPEEEESLSDIEETESRVTIQFQPEVRQPLMAESMPPRHISPPRMSPRPSVRTIPAFSMSEIKARTPERPRIAIEESQSKIIAPARVSKRSWVPALVLMFLMGEMLLMTAIIGMEKQLTVRADGSGMIVYDFEPELVAASIKALMEKR